MECMELKDSNINTTAWMSKKEETTPNYMSCPAEQMENPNSLDHKEPSSLCV